MKKAVGIILALAMTLSLCACGGSGSSASGSQGGNSQGGSGSKKALSGAELEEKGYHIFDETIKANSQIKEDYSNLDRDLTDWANYKRLMSTKKDNKTKSVWMKIRANSNSGYSGVHTTAMDYDTNDKIVNSEGGAIDESAFAQQLYSGTGSSIDYTSLTNKEIADVLFTKDENNAEFMKYDGGWNKEVLGAIVKGIKNASTGGLLKEYDFQITREAEEACTVGIYEDCLKCTGKITFTETSVNSVRNAGDVYYCFYIARMKYSDDKEPFVWGYAAWLPTVMDGKELGDVNSKISVDKIKECVAEDAYRTGITIVEEHSPKSVYKK